MGRYERYVVTDQTHGQFPVDWRDYGTEKSGETIARLKVCKNCLQTLNWQFYGNSNKTKRESIWNSFSITDFFMDYATFFASKPSRKDTDVSLSQYVKDWPEISKKHREEANWTCQECHAHLSQHPRLLHCRHRNGVRGDNSRSNLAVLCQICHSEQKYHAHMKVGIRAKKSFFRQDLKSLIKIQHYKQRRD